MALSKSAKYMGVSRLIDENVKALFDDKGIQCSQELQDVKKSLKIRETVKGNLDNRLRSREVIGASGTLPVSPSGSIQGPRVLASEDPAIQENWKRETEEGQNKFFDLLLRDDAFLDSQVYSCRNGYLIRNEDNENCSHAIFCNVLDELAINFAEKEPTSNDDRQLIDDLCNLCQNITLYRIYLASVSTKNIVHEKESVASFAAVMVGLKVYLRKLNRAFNF